MQDGHAVRGTTRDPARAQQLERAGAEAFVADPDRVVTLMPALDRVTVVCHLLGSARGERAMLEALHGPRLEMLLARLIDTTVRGVVYEATGSVPAELLHEGADRVRRACAYSHVPFQLLEAPPPEHHRAWRDAALEAIERLVDSNTIKATGFSS